VLAVLLMPFEYPMWLDELLGRLGATLVPIALVSVGYQLHLSPVRGNAYALTVGLVFKLAVAPALILLLFAGVLGAKGQVLSVTVFEAAMGPMIGAGIVVIDHELEASVAFDGSKFKAVNNRDKRPHINRPKKSRTVPGS
jgi:predicted permease